MNIVQNCDAYAILSIKSIGAVINYYYLKIKILQ